MIEHQSSGASPYKDSMMQRTDTDDEEISSDNAKAWDAFVMNGGGKVEGEGRGQ
jgi:hypothetical protein